MLHQVGLADAGNRRAGGYSLGMRQRLALATALLGDPSVLVLDEPANGLDPEGIQWLRGFLRHLAHVEGRTVLVSSHLLAEVEQTVDRVVIVGAGRLVREGSIAELRAGAEGAGSVVVRSPEAGRLAALWRRRAAGSTLEDADPPVGHRVDAPTRSARPPSPPGSSCTSWLAAAAASSRSTSSSPAAPSSTPPRPPAPPPRRASDDRAGARRVDQAVHHQGWLGLLLGSCVMAGGFAALFTALAGQEDGDAGSSGSAEYEELVFSTPTFPNVLLLILGIIGMTQEYRHRTATPTFLTTPRRGRVITAKVLAYAVVAVPWRW